MKQVKKSNDNKVAISKAAFVALVSGSLKGKELFKDKVDNAKKILKGNKEFVPSNSNK